MDHSLLWWSTYDSYIILVFYLHSHPRVEPRGNLIKRDLLIRTGSTGVDVDPIGTAAKVSTATAASSSSIAAATPTTSASTAAKVAVGRLAASVTTTLRAISADVSLALAVVAR